MKKIKNSVNIGGHLIAQGILPLFYHDDMYICFEIIQALYNAGIRVVEFTNRGSNALDNFVAIKNEGKKLWPDLKIGIGTITNESDVIKFVKAKTDFIISPIINQRIFKAVSDASIFWIPAVMTPTEVFYAHSLKLQFVKIFPAVSVGPKFISAIRDIFPDIYLMPTGGISINFEDLKTWVDAGSAVIGLGTQLISTDIINSRNYSLLTTNVKQVLVNIKAIKQ